MTTILQILISVALATQLFPAAAGIRNQQKGAGYLLLLLILVAGQLLALALGMLVGERINHLIEEYSKTVIFAGLFIIGVRMVMETLRIRKGERTYTLSGIKEAFLASVALSVNTFLVGMLITFMPYDPYLLHLALGVSAIFFSLTAAMMKLGKTTLALSSLLSFIAGLVMIVSSLLLSFFTT